MKKFSSNDEQFNKMTKTKMPKLVLLMAIPTVISQIVTVLYNTADTFFVSQIDPSASAAVGACFAIMALIHALGFGFGMGAGSLVSRCLGKKENDKANVYATSALFAALLIGILIAVFGIIFLNPLLDLLGCSKTMLPYAAPYAKYVLLAAPIATSQFVLNVVLRSQGKATLSMIGLGVSGLINIALDPLFIFTFGMGAGGAAIATGISQLLSFIYFIIVIFFTKISVVKIKLKYISLKIKDYFEILSTGLPTIFRQGIASLAAILLTRQGVVYGDECVSAITIANKEYTLVRQIVLGIGQGFQPIAGYNYGAGLKKRTWEAFRVSTMIGSFFCLVCSIFIFIFSKNIMSWFTDNNLVIDIGIETLHFVSYVLPFLAISTFINQLYQSLGYKLGATILASCRQGIFYVPAILILPLLLGKTGVELAQPVADLLTFIISVPFLIVFYHNHLDEDYINNKVIQS